MKRKGLFILVLVMIFALLTMPVSAAKPGGIDRVEDEVLPSLNDAMNGVAILMAGQDIEVGTVYINACLEPNTFEVRYEITEPGWFLTEIHFEAINATDDEFIMNKGTYIPGKFTAKQSFELIDEVTTYSFKYRSGDSVEFFAAHAVVSMIDCGIDETVPFGTALDYEQGMTLNYLDVISDHTSPGSVGTYETGRDWTNFISLGFQSDVEGEDTAWIIVEFDMPIQNKDGLDILVVEDTYGPYPIEKALVEASQDGIVWVELGFTANRIGLLDQVESYFDLGTMDWAKYIRVSDKSIREDFIYSPGEPNGFDLNAVISLQDNTTCWVVSESAWGAGVDAETSNWSMIIPAEGVPNFEPIHLESVEVFANGTTPVSSTSIMEEGRTYTLVVSGTVFAGDTIEFDAMYSITNRIDDDTWTDSVSGYTSFGPTLLDLFVNGVPSVWGPYTDTNIYEYTFVGDGSPLDLWIYDVYYPNNTGSLFVDIYLIP